MAVQRPSNPASSASAQTARTGRDYDKLVRQVADRVWQLWREELRRTRERQGSKTGR